MPGSSLCIFQNRLPREVSAAPLGAVLAEPPVVSAAHAPSIGKAAATAKAAFKANFGARGDCMMSNLCRDGAETGSLMT
jgi:hypothetical protein